MGNMAVKPLARIESKKICISGWIVYNQML